MLELNDILYFVINGLWLIQMCYNFFKIPEEYTLDHDESNQANHYQCVGWKEPFVAKQWIKFVNYIRKSSKDPYPSPNESMLRKITRRYLCTLFVFDFLSSVPPLLIQISPKKDDWENLTYALLMLRIVRIDQIFIPIKMLKFRFLQEKTLRKTLEKGTIFLLYILIAIHFLTCLWMYVGRMHNNPDSAIPNQSWMHLKFADGGYFRS